MGIQARVKSWKRARLPALPSIRKVRVILARGVALVNERVTRFVDETTISPARYDSDEDYYPIDDADCSDELHSQRSHNFLDI